MPKIDTSGKRIDLHQLGVELTVAGVPHGELALMGSMLVTVDQSGQTTDEWPTSAQTVVDNHTASPPIVSYTRTTTVLQQQRTANEVPVEILRIQTNLRHIYVASLTLTAIDANDGTAKRAGATMAFKRLSTGLAQIGATIPGDTMQDTAASTWQIQPSVNGTDLVFSVRGALGKTIDWLLSGAIEVYAPGGLAPAPSPTPPPPPDPTPPPPPLGLIHTPEPVATRAQIALPEDYHAEEQDS